MKQQEEWIMRGGSVVLPDEVRRLDIRVKDGVIVQLEEGIDPAGLPVVEAGGYHILPGAVDLHVHFNEPGMGEWEGFASGSSALAAGGCTLYADMPLNGLPPTIDMAALQEKLALARSHVDYMLWGGLVPGNLAQLPLLAEAGVCGFKAFMPDPGGPGEGAFRACDDLTLLEGMQVIAGLGLMLAIHAESEPLVAGLAARMRAAGRLTAADFAASRPVIAEVEAVRRALYFSRCTGCRVHFVHLSSREAVDAVYEAKLQGIAASAETCAHYLMLTEDDMAIQGPVAKCAPPLRSAAERELLWEALAAGRIDTVASDHSPCPTSWKQGSSFFDAWGGISGAQHTMELVLHEGFLKRNIPLPQLCRVLSLHPAQLIGAHPRKGEIRLGADADLAVADLGRGYTIARDDLRYRHKHSPYIGMELGCRIVQTYSRGRLAYDAGMNEKGGNGKAAAIHAGASSEEDGGLPGAWIKPARARRSVAAYES